MGRQDFAILWRYVHGLLRGMNRLLQWDCICCLNGYPDCPDHHLAEHEGVADAMDKLHLHKIDISGEIFIVNYEDYIGDSTANEIKYARENNKKIRWFSCDPIGEKVMNLITSLFKKEG